MAYVEFGNSWWGAKWLDALSGTDYENRLPRGKRYARNGSVRKIDISGRKISADVQGSRRRPYKVAIALPKFSRRDGTAVLDAVTGNPAFLSQLLNRQLPSALFDVFQDKKVPLFPRTWNDLSASCSCPDWAFCCKHIAAVIYLIANEIDKNPFLLFDLHDFDIVAALAKAGFDVADHRAVAIPHAKDLILNTGPAEDPASAVDDRDKLLGSLDFSAIPDLRGDLMALLADRPLFYPQKDFKQILDKALARAVRKAKAEIVRLTEFREKEDRAAPIFTDAEITLSDDLVLSDLMLAAGDNVFSTEDDDDPALLLALLFVVPPKQYHSHHDRVIALSLLTHFALRLLEKGAVIPEILGTGTGSRIRWLPALINARVKKTFEAICGLAPGDLVARPILTKPEQVKTVLSVFLAHFIALFCEDVADIRGDDVAAMFFAGATLRKTNRFQDREVAASIALWLGRFHIARKDFVPIVKVDEVDDGFALELLAENRKASMTEPVPLEKILRLKKFETSKYAVLKDIALLADWLPEINEFLASNGKVRPVFSHQEIETVLFRQLPVLKLLDIPILLPKGLERLLRPRLSASVSTSGSDVAASYLSLDDMLRFDWQVAIGDTLISAEEFRKLARDYRGIVKLKDTFVYLDDKEVGKLLRDLEAGPRLNPRETLKAALAGEHNGAALHLDDEARSLIAEMLQADPLAVPSTLKAELRDYQHRGYEWLAKNARLGFGSLIADDMGLGKTIQVLTLLLHWREEGRFTRHPALVVVPTSLLTNWRREAETFAPDLRVHTYHGGKREFRVKDVDVFLTSYGLLRRDQAAFAKQNWAAAIVDEAQAIKNANTAQSRAVKALKTGLRIAMTGTPVENRLSEYWSIFDFLNKGYLKGAKAFRDDFALPIEVDRNKQKLALFRKITAPFILRRLKSDKSIIKDLPDKVEIDQYCQLTKTQAALYQTTMEQIMESIETADDMERRGLVLKMITALKQVCNHPAHFLKKGPPEADLSGKTARLLELLRAMRDVEEKALLFTQYTEMGKLLETLIAKELHLQPLFLHGGLARRERDRIVDDFQQKPHVPILILSLKAGGTGLNLTAARNVVHFDLWWNPAVEAQATDRAYRIGQTGTVMVHRLITRGTFEEKINDMLKDKRELADLTVAAGEKWVGDYADRDLRKLFSLH